MTILCNCSPPPSPATLESGGATDGQVLQYNATTGEWEPADLPAAQTPLPAGEAGQVLVWDDVAGEWVAGDLPPAGVRLEPSFGSRELTQTRLADGEWEITGSGVKTAEPTVSTFTTNLTLRGIGELDIDDGGGVRAHAMIEADAPVSFNAPSVTGSRSGGTAFNSLLAALAQQGLITDNTTV